MVYASFFGLSKTEHFWSGVEMAVMLVAHVDNLILPTSSYTLLLIDL